MTRRKIQRSDVVRLILLELLASFFSRRVQPKFFLSRLHHVHCEYLLKEDCFNDTIKYRQDDTMDYSISDASQHVTTDWRLQQQQHQQEQPPQHQTCPSYYDWGTEAYDDDGSIDVETDSENCTTKDNEGSSKSLFQEKYSGEYEDINNTSMLQSQEVVDSTASFAQDDLHRPTIPKLEHVLPSPMSVIPTPKPLLQLTEDLEKQLIMYFHQAVRCVPHEFAIPFPNQDNGNQNIVFIVRRPYGLYDANTDTTFSKKHQPPRTVLDVLSKTPTRHYNRQAHISRKSTLEVAVCIQTINSKKGSGLPILILYGPHRIRYRNHPTSSLITQDSVNNNDTTDTTLGSFTFTDSEGISHSFCLKDLIVHAQWVRDHYSSIVTSTALGLSTCYFKSQLQQQSRRRKRKRSKTHSSNSRKDVVTSRNGTMQGALLWVASLVLGFCTVVMALQQKQQSTSTTAAPESNEL